MCPNGGQLPLKDTVFMTDFCEAADEADRNGFVVTWGGHMTHTRSCDTGACWRCHDYNFDMRVRGTTRNNAMHGIPNVTPFTRVSLE